MKIVKQFNDPSFYYDHNYLLFDSPEDEGYWKWGLSDDGQLYCQYSEAPDPNRWYSYDNELSSSYKVTFSDMYRIVKQFGNLLIFT